VASFRLHVASVSTRRAVSHAMCRLACDSYTCDPGDDAGAGAHPHVLRWMEGYNGVDVGVGIVASWWMSMVEGGSIRGARGCERE
jgi:hypothetical protein